MSNALRILIAEDDPLVRTLLCDMVQAIGHEVCATASSETSAVQEAADHRPDLIVADVTLGAGDGIKAAVTILEARKIACVFVTGDLSRATGAPKHAVVVQKPFSSKHLAQAIDEAWARVL